MSVIIKSVTKNSKAYKEGIKNGEVLISINGNSIVDVLDYRFYQTNRSVTLVVADQNGNNRTVNISKSEYEEIGLEFETYLMDKQHSCKNKCIFCFIDQLPKGMRKTLYFKDDDSRLSFLFGNYITLTNLTEHEISRIIKMRISPINVSVHTTNPELRVKMMANPNAGNALAILKRFADAKLKINCQIVSCPGINDGEELTRTLNDLTQLQPSVECIAVVPVGLTRYRENLFPLTEYTKETAKNTLELIENYAEKCYNKYGSRIVYASDEFYLKAQKPIPAPEYYGDFDQLENGVGLIALLKDEFSFALQDYTQPNMVTKTVAIASGTASAPCIADMLLALKPVFPNITVNVVPIINNFFGGGVNVSGLVTGTDLIAQLKNKNLGDKLIIPSVMLRCQGDLFLDDVSTTDVEKQLNIKLQVVKNDGYELLNAIIND